MAEYNILQAHKHLSEAHERLAIYAMKGVVCVRNVWYNGVEWSAASCCKDRSNMVD